MTHLLLSIEEIEADFFYQRSLLERYETVFKEGERGHDYYRLQGMIAIYESLLGAGKKISLDEKEIEEKANKAYPTPPPNMGAESFNSVTRSKKGYKRALNDLLNDN